MDKDREDRMEMIYARFNLSGKVLFIIIGAVLLLCVAGLSPMKYIWLAVVSYILLNILTTLWFWLESGDIRDNIRSMKLSPDELTQDLEGVEKERLADQLRKKEEKFGPKKMEKTRSVIKSFLLWFLYIGFFLWSTLTLFPIRESLEGLYSKLRKRNRWKSRKKLFNRT